MKENNDIGHDDSTWVRRNVTDEPRLSELVEMYESLGYETLLKDFIPEEHPDDCSQCMASFPERYKIIYTRKKSET